MDENKFENQDGISQNTDAQEPKNDNVKKVAIIIIAVMVVAAIAYIAMVKSGNLGGNGQLNADNSAPFKSSAPNITNKSSIATPPKASAQPNNGTVQKGSVAPANSSAPAPSLKTKLSAEDVMKIAQATAKKQFGDPVIVVPASEGAVEIDIDGTKRACFLFGADSMTADTSKGLRGLYHIDGNTGEVFDNGSGEMKKIS